MTARLVYHIIIFSFEKVGDTRYIDILSTKHYP